MTRRNTNGPRHRPGEVLARGREADLRDRRAAAPAGGRRPGLLCPCHLGCGHYGNVRVLVVEDQKVLADRIAEGLRDQGMAVDVAYDGAAAMEVTAFTRYDVIVLDRDLPRVHGDAVCASLVGGPAPGRGSSC